MSIHAKHFFIARAKKKGELFVNCNLRRPENPKKRQEKG